MSAAAHKSYLSPEEERALAERMTAAILLVVRRQKCCEPHDLKDMGFTEAEIERCWTLAKASADFELRISKR